MSFRHILSVNGRARGWSLWTNRSPVRQSPCARAPPVLLDGGTRASGPSHEPDCFNPGTHAVIARFSRVQISAQAERGIEGAAHHLAPIVDAGRKRGKISRQSTEVCNSAVLPDNGKDSRAVRALDIPDNCDQRFAAGLNEQLTSGQVLGSLGGPPRESSIRNGSMRIELEGGLLEVADQEFGNRSRIPVE